MGGVRAAVPGRENDANGGGEGGSLHSPVCLHNSTESVVQVPFHLQSYKAAGYH